MGLVRHHPPHSSRSQEAILDIKRIRVSYLRTWFIPDVIAAFPIGYILLFAVKINKLPEQIFVDVVQPVAFVEI